MSLLAPVSPTSLFLILIFILGPFCLPQEQFWFWEVGFSFSCLQNMGGSPLICLAEGGCVFCSYF